MQHELERLNELFGPRKYWYVQGGDGQHVTEHARFTSLEEVSEWIDAGLHAAFYYQVQISGKEIETRPNFDEIEQIVAFPIDIDPATETRPSTERERTPCFDVADKIADELEQRGLGRPVKGDSGNGAQLFIRLRVDVTDQTKKVYWYDLFKRVQAWIKKEFADPRVQIDSVSDFARIMALPGSEKRKVVGTSGPSQDRPFRKVEFLDEGEATDVVKFETFASGLPMVESAANEDLSFKLVQIPQETLDGLPPKVVEMINNWDKPQTDQSETAFAIASELYSVGWNLDIIYTILYTLYEKHPKESKRSRASELAARALRAAMIPSNERIREAYLHAPKRKESKSVSMAILKQKTSDDDDGGTKVTLTFQKPLLPAGIPDSTLGKLKEKYPFSDAGNGERMFERWGRYAKHLDEADQKGWMIFRQSKWESDPNRAEIRKLAVANARLIMYHESADTDKGDLKEVVAHAKRSENTGGITAAITEFGPHVRGTITEFDQNPSLFNVTNGTLVIEGDIVYKKDHDPDDLITRIAGTYYDPNAKAPKWQAFLEKNIPDLEVREWLRRYTGSMLSGRTKDKTFAMGYGETNTGKTVFKETILGVLGGAEPSSYGAVTKWKMFDDDANPDMAQRELARFRGMRGIFAAENNKKDELNVSLIKEITGMDTTSAREIFKISFQYKPTYKFLLVGNNRLRAPPDEADSAFWDRTQIVPFEVVIPKAERISHYHEVLLKEEAPGILNWMIGGLKDWLKFGMPPAKRMEEEKQKTKEENNSLIPFAKECCDFGENLTINYASISMAYDQWAQRTGSPKYDNRTAMGRRVLAIPGVSAGNDAEGNRIYKGIALKTVRVSETVRHGVVRQIPDSSGQFSQTDTNKTSHERKDWENRQELSDRQESEVPVGRQATLEQAEPALTEVVESIIAAQSKIAEAKGDTETYAQPAQSVGASKIAAFDLETVNLNVNDPNNRILSIGLAGSDGFRESWAFDSEIDTIRAFIEKASEYECLLGWNTDKFDLPVLRARVEGWDDTAIPPVLDALRAHKQLLRKSETKMQLDFVAKKYLKEGKLDFDPTRTVEFFEKDRETLRKYNLRDAELVLRLNDVMGYWSTFKGIYDESQCADEKWQYAMRTFALRSEKKQENGFVWWRPIMGLIQRYCERHNIPNPFDWPNDSEKETRKELMKEHAEKPGGFVMNPVKGHHHNVIEFDFKSLYPSLIISFDIDPMTWMPPGNGDIKAPFGSYNSRITGIIPGVLAELVTERSAAKKELAAAKARGASKEEMAALKGRTEALKILNNSFYGQYYAPFSPLFHFDSARNITTLGQECVQLMLHTVKDYGARAIAGDTDSTYIEVSSENLTEDYANRLSAILTQKIAAHLKEKYNVDFMGAFDFKGLYSDLAIYKKKRYAKLERGKPVGEMDVIGYERGDVYELQLDLQEEIFRRMIDPSRGTIPGAISDARERLRSDHTLVLRWKRGETSAEGRALRRLTAVGLPPAPGDSVGFLITGKDTKKFPERRIAARRLDSESVEWVTETDDTPHRERIFLNADEEQLIWDGIMESLDGVRDESMIEISIKKPSVPRAQKPRKDRLVKRSNGARIIQLTKERVLKLLEIGYARGEFKSESLKNYSRRGDADGRWLHCLGVVAEGAVAQAKQLDVDTELYLEGDTSDLNGNEEVKWASWKGTDIHLKLKVDEYERKSHIKVYYLVRFDEPTLIRIRDDEGPDYLDVELLGMITREDFERKKKIMDYGHGPNYIVGLADLQPFTTSGEDTA